MNFYTDRFFRNRSILLIGISLMTFVSFGQKQTHFTLNCQGGSNVMFGSVNSLPGYCLNLSTSYAVSKLFTINAETELGNLHGKGTIRAKTYEYLNSEDASSRTTYLYYGLSGLINIRRILFPIRKHFKYVPYISVGSGYLLASSQSSRFDRNSENQYEHNYYTSSVGFILRVKHNRRLDYFFSARYYITQTYFLDAIPNENQYDSFSSFTAGISYKLNTRSRRSEFVDWVYRPRYICPPMRRW